MELFRGLKIVEQFGYLPTTPAYMRRLAINAMLLHYLGHLAILAPEIAVLLVRRFRQEEPIKAIALSVHASQEQINRKQGLGIFYLASMINDDEVLVRLRR